MNRFTLKMIAVISMLIDHTGVVLFPNIILLRVIGRLAFPIYCFFLVEGFCYTSNLKKYMMRLGIFALISEIPFDLFLHGTILEFQSQNVFFTLFIGVVVLYVLEKVENVPLKVIAFVTGCILGTIIRTDYSFIGVYIIVVFYIFRRNFISKTLFMAPINLLGTIQPYAILAMIPIYFYNGKKGLAIKYFFYLFYPIHLIILYLIKLLV